MLLLCCPAYAITRSAAQKKADALWGTSAWISERWDHPKVCTAKTIQPPVGPPYQTNVCVVNAAKVRHVFTVCRIVGEIRECLDGSSYDSAFRNAGQ